MLHVRICAGGGPSQGPSLPRPTAIPLSSPAIFALIVASPSRGTTMTKDAISYIRVSSEEQADSGLGLEAQRQRIAAYCRMKGLHLAETFEDPGTAPGNGA